MLLIIWCISNHGMMICWRTFDLQMVVWDLSVYLEDAADVIMDWTIPWRLPSRWSQLYRKWTFGTNGHHFGMMGRFSRVNLHLHGPHDVNHPYFRKLGCPNLLHLRQLNRYDLSRTKLCDKTFLLFVCLLFCTLSFHGLTVSSDQASYIPWIH